MSTAKKTLEELSKDPEARRIASARETAVLMHRHLMNASREEGREEGRQEGREEGRQEGREEGERVGEERGREEALRGTLIRQLRRRFGQLPSWVEDQVAQADIGRLEACLDAVLTDTTLESVLTPNSR